MALNDITLSSSIRSNLINLQTVADLMSRTSDRLATGKKVINPIDDPQAFFTAQNLNGRASDLSDRKTAMGNAIQTVQTANEGVKGIIALVQQAKGLIS
jgi:flagellin